MSPDPLPRFRTVHGWLPCQPGESFRPQVTVGGWPFPRPLHMAPSDAWLVTHFHGASEISMGGQTTPVVAETVMVFPPRSRFRVLGQGRFSKQTQVRLVGLDLPTWFEEADIKPGVPYPLGQGLASVKWVRILHDEWGRPNRDPVLAGMIFRCWLREIRRSRGPVAKTAAERLSLAHARLTEGTESDFTIESLAREFGVTRRHLTETYRAARGLSPKQALLQARLEKARRLLSTGPMPVNRIGKACGFDDPFHFSRTFRRHFGLAPKAWREAKARSG